MQAVHHLVPRLVTSTVLNKGVSNRYLAPMHVWLLFDMHHRHVPSHKYDTCKNLVPPLDLCYIHNVFACCQAFQVSFPLILLWAIDLCLRYLFSIAASSFMYKVKRGVLCITYARPLPYINRPLHSCKIHCTRCPCFPKMSFLPRGARWLAMLSLTYFIWLFLTIWVWSFGVICWTMSSRDYCLDS